MDPTPASGEAGPSRVFVVVAVVTCDVLDDSAAVCESRNPSALVALSAADDDAIAVCLGTDESGKDDISGDINGDLVVVVEVGIASVLLMSRLKCANGSTMSELLKLSRIPAAS